MSTVLFIEQAAMCCALGYSLEAASAAMSARLDHFRESWFVDRAGRPLHCAMIWDNELWGPSRMGFMFEHVLAEIFHKAPELDPTRICLMLLTPEKSRPGGHEGWPQEIFAACTDKTSFHASSRICPGGRAGIGLCLRAAGDILASGEAQQVILAGVDSYLTVGAIEHFLDADRLLAAGPSDGFIPGEGAAALLLGRERPGGSGLHVTGVGLAHEPAHIGQDELPNRSTAFTAAAREAEKECGYGIPLTHFRMSDCSGDTLHFKEAAHGMFRLSSADMDPYPHMLIASALGETGAAAGPLMLAWLTRLLGGEYAPGSRGFLHFANDDGARAAVMVEYRKSEYYEKR